MTTLVADDPRTGQEIVLADDMEFASWDDAFDQVQVKLCSDPICGMEGCAPGSWVTARLIDDGTTVELGLSRHFESEDEDVEPDDVEDYWPPRWMQERGPVRVPRGDWERIAHEAAFEVQTAPAE